MDSESTEHLVEELHHRPHKSISEKERESDCPADLVEELHYREGRGISKGEKLQSLKRTNSR
jgi:hypothetical protein